MCRHVYHHYHGCGHISNYTMESCCAFTNQLRMFATMGDLATQQSYATCDDIDTFHDILPVDHPDFCLKCAYDWSDRQMGENRNLAQPPSIARPFEGLEAVHPLFDIQARMAVNTSLDTTEMRNTWDSDQDLESETSLLTDNSLHLEPLAECDALETQVHELSETGDGNDGNDAVLTNLEWDWLRNPMGHPGPSPSPPCPDVSELTGTDRELASRSSGFVCVSHATQEDEEDLPLSVTNSLAQLDLDCTEDSFSSRPSSSSTNKIDLLSKLPSRDEILTELVQVFKQQASSPNFSDATFGTYQGQETPPLLLKGFRYSESRNSLWRADMSKIDDFTLLWTYQRSYVKEKGEDLAEDLASSTQSFYTADEDEEDDEEGGCSLL